jgi:hypothetical protein
LKETQSSNAKEVSQTVAKLNAPHFLSQESSQRVFRMGGPALLVVLLERWPQDQYIQIECCTAIGLLSGERMLPGKSFETTWFDLEAMEPIANSLKKFPQSESLQEDGIGALANFFRFKDNMLVDTTATKFVQCLDGLQIVVDAMQKFPSNEDLQFHACHLLSNLCNCGDFKATMLKSGVLVAVSTAKTTFSDCRGIGTHSSKVSKLLFGD